MDIAHTFTIFRTERRPGEPAARDRKDGSPRRAVMESDMTHQ
ncbi:hypothetical protein F750_4177 [Streptomyces sp. PAMC 26508]|nr:hypothetical protein F750_4177 [Streptomyces sp. PAMC 26508]